MKNRINDLRDHLFATIEGLLDEDKPMEIDRAEAVAKVADTIVRSAKVEVDFMKVTGAEPKGQGFFLPGPEQKQLPGKSTGGG